MSASNMTTAIPSGHSTNRTSNVLSVSNMPVILVMEILLMAVVTVACILGNSLIILAVLLVKKLRTSSNYLIVSLAVSDWLVGMIVMPLSIIYEVLDEWTLGKQVCSMWVTFDVMLCTASILNLMMISIDRYLAITRPFQYSQKRTTKLMLLYIAAAWTISATISVTPMMVGWNTQHIDGECIINQEIGYQIYATLAAFYLPLMVMIALYTRIFFISTQFVKAEAKNKPSYIKSIAETGMGNHLDASENSDVRNQSRTADTELINLTTENNSHVTSELSSTSCVSGGLKSARGSDDDDIKLKTEVRKKSIGNSQAIKTLGVIMGMFVVCWLPFFILAVVRPVCGESCQVPKWTVTLLTWLGYVNSCLNPVIYARFNREFRIPFKEILCLRCQSINQSVRYTEYLYRYGN